MGRNKMKLTIKCEVREGWAYIELSKRASWEMQSLIATYISDLTKYGMTMQVIHRLSRIHMELDKSDKLEMLSREDMQAISKCIPTELESVFRGFHVSNWFKHDNSRFSEANQILKGMHEIHDL
jgi:hypothetical protein